MHKGKGSTTSTSNMSYTVNWAAAEDVWRQTTTPLPFHLNSLFGYLRSNPAIHNASAGSSVAPMRGRENTAKSGVEDGSFFSVADAGATGRHNNINLFLKYRCGMS
jgi:hypothetical protein